MASLGFRVYGDPVQQGSKNPGRSAKTGKLFVYEQTGERLKDWRSNLREAAILARGDTPTIPKGVEVAIAVTFYVRRPASIPVKKRRYPTVAPDLDKYLRALGDALKDAAVYADDAQIVSIQARKVYADESMERSPGAWIVITTPDTLPSTQV